MPEDILRWRITGVSSSQLPNSVANVPSPFPVFRGTLKIAVTSGPLSREVAWKTCLLTNLLIY